jgi:hypothetical protein
VNLLARLPEGGAASQPVQRVYWPENVIDWLGKWRPTCVMRHARGQKLQSFRLSLFCGYVNLCIKYRSFSSDVTAAILVYQNNEMAAILVYGTGIGSFLFKYFVLFHHPTGATDHVSENDLLYSSGKLMLGSCLALPTLDLICPRE